MSRPKQSKTVKEKTQTINKPLMSKKPGWIKDSRFLVPLALYLVMLYVWRANIFEGLALNITPDRVTGISFRRMVSLWLSQGVFPFWNPYFYGGMAMFESFQSSWLFYPFLWLGEGFIADPANPGFYNGGLAWLLFFGSPVDFMLLHHLIGAVGIAFTVRHFGGNGWVQFIAGTAFLLSPQLVVLADVGHGSKLYAMCWLPWLFLALNYAYKKPGFVSIAALGAAFSILMSTQHIQVAYYGYMMAGLWWVLRIFNHLKKQSSNRILPELGILAAGGLLGVAATSVIYLNTLTFTQETIRGSGGVSWEYATNWSYHPLESLSMFVPDFFGFGGRTYWGYQPFTDMPLYWGIVISIFALIALFFAWNWKIRGMFIVGLLAWVTSFGSFAPILYRPFYNYLPYFNKFRVPMMIHILVLIMAVVLAGIGIQKVIKIRDAEDKVRKKMKKFIIAALSVCGILLIVALIFKGGLSSSIASWANAQKPGIQNALKLGETSVDSLSRSLLFAIATLGISLAWVMKKIPQIIFTVLLSVLILLDLVPLTGRLLHPSSDAGVNLMFYKDGVVKAIENGPKGRLLPLDVNRPPINSWGAKGIEVVAGYTGSKPSTYGYLEEKNALTSLNIMSVMNVRYLHSPNQIPGLNPIVHSKSGYLYENPGNPLSRTYLRADWEVIPETRNAIDRIISQDFNPQEQLVLDREPVNVQKQGTVKGNTRITHYDPNSVTVEVETDNPAILVLADAYSEKGWSAKVNNSPCEIMRANGMQRAVVVNAGKSEVHFKYRPAHWGLSLFITIIAWSIMLILLVWGIVKSRTNKSLS